MASNICPSCEKPFPALVARGRRRRYCSDACRRAMHNRRRRLERGSVARSDPTADAPKKRAGHAKAAAPQTPEKWAAWVRGRYELDASEDMLVSLAVDALRLSQDVLQDPRVRLTAAGRFQALLRQLDLAVAEEEAQAKGSGGKKAETGRSLPRKAVDPRKVLSVLK